MDIRKESIKRVFNLCGVVVVDVESVGCIIMVDIFSAEEQEMLLRSKSVLRVGEGAYNLGLSSLRRTSSVVVVSFRDTASRWKPEGVS